MDMFAEKNNENIKEINDISEDVLNYLCSNKTGNSSYKVFKDTLDLILTNNEEIIVGIELIYVDRIYRDAYYNFFSNLHTDFSRICKRLVFFNSNANFNHSTDIDQTSDLNKNFIGSMVIRPLYTGAIGRTLLNPLKILGKDEEYYIRTSEWKVYFMGFELSVKAFPYLMQDGIITSCAETVLLSTMDYYSRQYNDYQFALPSTISEISMREKGTRAIPTNGLSYETMSKILCEFGFYTTFDCNFDLGNLRRYLYYYIESGMPVIINMQRNCSNSLDSNTGHAALCIGHGNKEPDQMLKNIEFENGLYYANTALAHKKIYVMDDNLHPYSYYTYNYPPENYLMKREDGIDITIDCYIIPLHKHMYMDAKRAEDVVRELLSTEEEHTKIYNPITYYNSITPINSIKWGTKGNPIIYRLFLASSRHLKHHRIIHTNNQYLKKLYIETPMPQFVWVCEFYDKFGYEKNNALGEIIIDATRCSKSSLFSSVLMINYSGSAHFSRNYTGSQIFLDPSKISQNNKKDIILESIKNNNFYISPYNMNLHDKEYFVKNC